MATMSSPPPEDADIAIKVAPVVAEKTERSQDINGTANISPADSFSPASNPDVNGHTNVDAHAINGEVHAAAASLKADDAPMSVEPAHNTVVAERQEESLPLQADVTTHDAAVHDAVHDAMEDVQAVIDNAVDTAMNDIIPATGVPPIVEAPQSDLRDHSPPPNEEHESQADQPASAEQSTPLESQMQVEDVNNVFIPQEQLSQTAMDTGDVSGLTTQISTVETSILQKPEAMQESPMDIVATQITDVSMEDAKDTKLKTERQEDDQVDGEPSAKRQKTFDTAGSPQSPAFPNGNVSSTELTARTMSPADVKEVVRQIRNTVRSKAGVPFAKPVIEAVPTLADAYLAKIPNPMDFRTMEQKLLASQYTTFDSVLADVDLMVNNCINFNGPEHNVTKLGHQVKDTTQRKIIQYLNPPIQPPPPPKRRASTPASEKKVPRKASRAPTAPIIPPTPTYALNPETQTPLIRRDSSAMDASRPKREIHPPKSKDLEYQNVRPRSKKFALELKFCDNVLAELKKPRYDHLTMWFSAPVDPVALGIPDYLKKIKKPMDLGTVTQKLDTGYYEKAKDFEADMRLIFRNCYQFNGKEHAVSRAAQELEAYFDAEWSKKDTFLANHTPIARSPAAAPDDDDDSEEDEHTDDDATDDAAAQAADSVHADRLITEQSKLIALMSSGTAQKIEIELQQGVVDAIQKIAEKLKADAGRASKVKGKNKPKVLAGSKKSKKASVPVRKSSGSAATAAARKPKPKKEVFIGTVEKEIISAGLGHLPDEVAGEALNIIQTDREDVEVGDDGTLELDIEVISEAALRKIYGLIMKHVPHVKKQVEKDFNDKKQGTSHSSTAKPAGGKKKHKPMNAREQEAQIAKLGAAIGVNGSPQSPGSGQGFATAPEAESSGDEASDSEEE